MSILFSLIVFMLPFLLMADEKQITAPSTAIIKTNRGEITVRLRPDVAPKAVENFVGHAKNNYYNGIIFHRVIKDFMVQGGDPTGTGRGGESIWKKPFADECSTSVTFTGPGILAMANSGPSTNGSQFFITTAATPWLNGRHTIFGEVIDGLDIVRAIEGSKVNAMDKPLEDQKILSVAIVR